MYPSQYGSTGYGSNYSQGSYGYGQGYQGSSYQTSYYGQGYGNYQQGYQGNYGGGYNSGMGNQFSYVDNNWIEDQLRFAVTDVQQNRPYGAMQKLQSLTSYVQQFGDSALYRRVQLAIRLGYKSSLTAEVQGLYNDWKAGKMRLGWESGANQSYDGQDDISKEYILGQLNSVIGDLNGGKQNRARQRLMGLQSAIPPRGNERLVRRIYYASTVSRPSQMTSEVNVLIQEIQSGSLILNDTENNAANYYYGSGSTDPYSQPDTGYPGGGGPNMPPFGGGGLPGDGPRYGDTTYLPDSGAPGPGGIQYPPPGAGAVWPLQPTPTTGQPGVVDYQNPVQNPPVAGTNVAPSVVPAAPVVDLPQLKANVAAAYSKLKAALSEGDPEKIKAAQSEYATAQAAYEQAKQ
jgi:hypothetical protein